MCYKEKVMTDKGRFDWIARDNRTDREIHYRFNHQRSEELQPQDGVLVGEDFYTRDEWEELKAIIDDIFDANEGEL